MKKLKFLPLIGAVAVSTTLFGVVEDGDFNTTPIGSIPLRQPIVTNVEEVIKKVDQEIGDKADKFLPGANLSFQSELYKLTPGDVDSGGGTGRFPYLPYVYSTSTNNMNSATLYDFNLQKLSVMSSTDDLIGANLGIDEFGTLMLLFRVDGAEVSVHVESVETVLNSVLSATTEDQITYGYSHPHDWNVYWEALDDMDTTHTELISETWSTNVVGQVIKTLSFGTFKNGSAELSIRYFDEVNLPNFGTVEFTKISGPGTISGNILHTEENGVVVVRATTELGTYRDCPISMFTWASYKSENYFMEDLLPARKRIHDYHYALLEKYRSNPTTNRNYTTWSEEGGNKHIGWNGDMYNGNYGKHLFPYQHRTVNNGGGSGWWSTHGIISKHVLLAVNHYGDWNHSRAKNMTTYVNYDNKFSGKTPVKCIKYVNLNTWAQEHGFSGTDAAMGDLGAYIISTADYDGGANLGIPDECLPYLATADYLNATYGMVYEGTNSVFQSAGLACVTLNQASMVGLGSTQGPGWSGVGRNGHEGIDDPEIIPVERTPYLARFRRDIAMMIARCGFHRVVIGDSGQPSFIYDPALTTGLTYDFGEGDGPEPLLRPILLTAYTSTGGGTSVAMHLNVIKAFCESVGDTLDYVLGDIDTQSTDSTVVKDNAIEFTKALKMGPNADPTPGE